LLFFPKRVPLLLRWPWLHGMLRGIDGVLLLLVDGGAVATMESGLCCVGAVEDSALGQRG
jgi:hypothetical protein